MAVYKTLMERARAAQQPAQQPAQSGANVDPSAYAEYGFAPNEVQGVYKQVLDHLASGGSWDYQQLLRAVGRDDVLNFEDTGYGNYYDSHGASFFDNLSKEQQGQVLRQLVQTPSKSDARRKKILKGALAVAATVFTLGAAAGIGPAAGLFGGGSAAAGGAAGAAGGAAGSAAGSAAGGAAAGAAGSLAPIVTTATPMAQTAAQSAVLANLGYTAPAVGSGLMSSSVFSAGAAAAAGAGTTAATTAGKGLLSKLATGAGKVGQFVQNNPEIAGGLISGIGQGLLAGQEADARADAEIEILREQQRQLEANYAGVTPGRNYRGLLRPGTGTSAATRLSPDYYSSFEYKYDPEQGGIVRVPTQ